MRGLSLPSTIGSGVFGHLLGRAEKVLPYFDMLLILTLGPWSESTEKKAHIGGVVLLSTEE